MRTMSKNVIRYGLEASLPEPKTLTAGPLRVDFEEGGLRSIFCGRHEIVRGIYAAVRDRDWGTVPGKLSGVEIHESTAGFSVRYVAEHQARDVHFTWTGLIEGNSDGTLMFEMDGTARSAFLKNRIGFCILHPMELAGTTVKVNTTEGDVVGVFPESISPHQPFVQMTGMQYSVGDSASVEISFQGDIFEMEDQRNWTDASYKTYCTPLGLPFPVEVHEGQRIHQRIVVTTRTGNVTIQNKNLSPTAPRVTVGSTAVQSVPKMGFGYTRPSSNSESTGMIDSDVVLESLKELRPNFLRVSLDLTAGLNEWRSKLTEASSQAQTLGAALHGEAVIDQSSTGLEELMQYLGTNGSMVSHLFVFNAKTQLASSELLRKAKLLAEKHRVPIRIGGGTRAFFTEVNRAQLPLNDMDFIGYTMNPQVHAFDNQSLMDTLPVQAATVKTARQRIGPDKELEVGPITFKMLVNPNATSDASIPFVDTVDVRQKSLFGAAWTVGSLQHLMASDVDAITYFETIGPRGLMDGEGQVFPLYHVFRDVADATEVLPVQVSDKTAVGAVAVRAFNKTRMLVANLKPDTITVELAFPDLDMRDVLVRYLDENSFAEAVEHPETFRSGGNLVVTNSGVTRLMLLPYAVGTVDFK